MGVSMHLSCCFMDGAYEASGCVSTTRRLAGSIHWTAVHLGVYPKHMPASLPVAAGGDDEEEGDLDQLDTMSVASGATSVFRSVASLARACQHCCSTKHAPVCSPCAYILGWASFDMMYNLLLTHLQRGQGRW
jgi:hypothetical protein